MKKIRIIALFSLIILARMTANFALHTPIELVIDGEHLNANTPPLLKDQQFYIPARLFCQSQNATLLLDPSDQMLIITPYKGTSVKVSPLFNGPLAYVKVKDLESLFNLNVQWQSTENRLILYSPYRIEKEDSLRFANGNWYKGEIVNQKRHGFGKMFYVNGRSYEGYFENHRKHGKGISRDVKGMTKDELWIRGVFQDGKFVHENQFDWASGASYEGHHTHGIFEGKGELTLESGGNLSGYFSEGYPIGGFTVLFDNGTKAFLNFSDQNFRAKVYYENEFLTELPPSPLQIGPSYITAIDGIKNLHEEQETFQKETSKILKSSLSKYNLDSEYVGIYVEELQSHYHFTCGNELEKDPYNQMVAGKFSVASAIKFPLTFAVLKHLEENNLPINSPIYDDLSKKHLSLEQVMKNAVSKSINSNFNYLIRYLGADRANEILKAYGARHSRVNGELGGADPLWSLERLKSVYGTYYVSRVTPKDFGKLLRIVYDESRENNPYMTFLNQLLLENVYNARIPRGVSFKYPVAHKTGTYIEMGQFADVGIVYHESNPYIVVILMDRQKDTTLCEPFMRDFVKKINAYMSQRKS